VTTSRQGIIDVNRLRLQQIEAALISVGGLLLLVEISNAVRSNVWWIGRAVLAEQRFSLYLWASVALSLLFVVEGAVTIRERQAGRGFLGLLGPLAIVLVGVLIIIAHGWRIRTDVAPADGISTLSDLPIAVRVLADPWLAAVLIAVVATCAAWSSIHVLRGRRAAERDS